MHIRVGILGGQGGWDALLQQIGIPFLPVANSLLPQEFSAVVAGDSMNDRETEMLRQYLALGGAVLCSARAYGRLHHTTIQNVYVDYVSPGPKSVFRSVGILDIQSSCQLAWNANELRTKRGAYSAYVGTRTNENIIALPFDPSILILDTRSTVKSFYSPEQRMPFETVSLVSKGEIRMLVSDCLELLHHRRGIPFIHLWPFPHHTHAVFCFRIDTDYGTDEQMNALESVIHRNGISATWFIDTKSHEHTLKRYTRMHKQEYGIHCYEHETFPEYDRNVQNIRKAQAILQTAKLDARGFAAPFGIWNQDLGRALVDCGFEYSSEFSYDYDNMPGYPRLSNGQGVMQIPIHPICIGSLKRHGYDDEAMISYFDFVIDRKIRNREPIILYHHPKDGHFKVLDWIFQEMRKKYVQHKTMGEYAHWWQLRTASLPEIRYTKGSIHLRGMSQDRSLAIRISRPDGTEAILPMSKQVNMEAVRWTSKPASWSLPDDYVRIRGINYRIPLVRGLDTVMKFIRQKKK